MSLSMVVESLAGTLLGALEPLTALILGIAFLGEALSLRLTVGAFLVLGAVIFVILRPVRG